MLQQTVDRIEPMVPRERIIVVTGADQAEATRPSSRRSAPGEHRRRAMPARHGPCVGLAAWIVRKKDPDGIMIVMPADHVIQPIESFPKTVRAAVSVIEADPTTLVTFGIKPTRPETGYGYIERGERLDMRDGIPVNRVIQFREKPDADTAEAFLAAGNFAWNSGMFLWKAGTILDELQRHRPGLAAALDRVGEALGTADQDAVIAGEYPLMERAPSTRP